jgi:hypothetical protein
MEVERLAMCRDAALILLALEAFGLGLLLAATLYQSLRGLGRLLERIRPVLFQARMVTWRTQELTSQAMSARAAPFIGLQSALEGLLRVLDVLGWR